MNEQMNNQNISNWCNFLLRLFGKRKRRKEREAQVEERGKKWRPSLVLSRSFLFCALPHTRLAFNWGGLKNATNCRLSSFISLLLSLMLFSRSPCACISLTENMKVASVQQGKGKFNISVVNHQQLQHDRLRKPSLSSVLAISNRRDPPPRFRDPFPPDKKNPIVKTQAKVILYNCYAYHSTLKMLYSRARWCFNLKKAYLKTNSHTSFKCPMFYIQLSKWTLNETSIEAVWQQQATSKQEPFYFGEAWKV